MNLVRFHKPSYAYTINSLLNDFANDCASGVSYNTNVSQSAVNVAETDKDFVLELLAPGYDKEAFSVTHNNGVLTVKAEAQKADGEKLNYTRKSFSISGFERNFKVPEKVNVEEINAQYKNGILKVMLPKKEAEVQKAMVNVPIQ